MIHSVTSGSGARLAVHDNGRPGPTVLFLHGWAQSARCWDGQLAELDFRCLAADLRGHGCSSVPDGGYHDPAAWAEDVRALVAFAGAPVVLVGWSYGGLVIADYLRAHGETALAGLVLVGAITELGRGLAGGRIGPVMRTALPDALDEDPDVALRALRGFTAGMTGSRGWLPGAWYQARLGDALRVPPKVRAALFARRAEHGDTLAGLRIPALVLHGTEDPVVDVSAGEYARGKIPTSHGRWVEGVGHAPFAEARAEFNEALRRFVADL